MLIIARREGEKVIVTAIEPIPAGTEIVITQCRFGGINSRLGIEAGPMFQILREEIYQKHNDQLTPDTAAPVAPL